LGSACAKGEVCIIDYEAESGLKLSLGRVVLPSVRDAFLSEKVREGAVRGQLGEDDRYAYDSGAIEWPLVPPAYIGRTWVNNPAVNPICVNIKCANGISKADSGGGKKSKSDAYVMLWWIACKGGDPRSRNDVRIGETKIMSDNSSPIWMESFAVPIPSAACIESEGINPADCALLCQVFDSDSQGADDFLGQAKLDMATLMKAKGEAEYELKARGKRKSFAGPMKGESDDKKLLAGSLTVVVKRSATSATAAVNRMEKMLLHRTTGSVKMRVRMGESTKFLVANDGASEVADG
jgi:hypothetical protein